MSNQFLEGVGTFLDRLGIFMLICVLSWGILGTLEMMNIGEGTP